MVKCGLNILVTIMLLYSDFTFPISFFGPYINYEFKGLIRDLHCIKSYQDKASMIAKIRLKQKLRLILN